MRNKVAMALLMTLTISLFAAEAETPDSEWKWQREIMTDTTSGFNRLELPPEIYKKSQLDLWDLRIIDEKGTVVPYFLESNRKTSTTTEDSYSFTSTGDFRKKADTIFDFQGHPTAGTDLLINHLTVATDFTEDFFKYVELYGSHDGKHWEWIENSSLYRVDGNDQFLIDVGTSQKFTNYRIVILNNAEGIRLSGLSGMLISESEVQTAHQRIITASQFQRREVGTATEIQIKNVDNLPVNAMSIEASGLFKRPCQIVSGENEAVATVFGSGYLFQSTLKGSEPLRNSLPVSIYQPVDSLTLVIENGDNPPLDIQSVTLEYVSDAVVFQTVQGKTYTLQYGNPSATKPQYDLEQFRGEISLQQIGTAVLNAEKAVAVSKQPSKTVVNQKAIFSGVIFLVALVLALFAIRGMRKS